MKKLSSIFAILCLSMFTFAQNWTGQVTGTATNVWLDGVGSNDNRITVEYTVNYLFNYADGTLNITIGFTDDNFNKTVGLVPQLFVDGAYKGDLANNKYALTGCTAGQVLNLSFYFAYNGGASTSTSVTYTVPTDGNTGNETPDPEQPENPDTPDTPAGNIDWNNYDFLGDGAGEGMYNNLYKVAPDEGQTAVNIQVSPNGKAGIYTNFLVAIADCSLPEGQYEIDGAGIWLYLTAFTYKETAVSVNDVDGKTYNFVVYYLNGVQSPATSVEQITTSAPARKIMENGMVYILHNGVRYNTLGQIISK